MDYGKITILSFILMAHSNLYILIRTNMNPYIDGATANLAILDVRLIFNTAINQNANPLPAIRTLNSLFFKTGQIA